MANDDSSKSTTVSQTATTSSPMSVEQAYQLAEQHFNHNNLQQAESLCRQILQILPSHSNTLHLLGLIGAKTGYLAAAEQLILQAITLNPTVPLYHNNLANVYYYQGKLELAIPHWEKANDRSYLHWVVKYDTLTAETIQQMRQLLQQWHSPPLISVVMPVYNIKEEWLRAAIESVRNQIYPYWELCIADDASTLPHIRTVLTEYAMQDSRIKVAFRTVNGHISAASNTSLELVEGDFVALLDHDDALPPHALFFVAGEIITHPNAMLIYSDEDKMDTQGRRSEPYFKCDWNPDLFLSHNLITHLGVYKTALVHEIGGFREGYEGAQDYDLALRVIEKISPQQIRHIPHILYHWRLHEESASANLFAKLYAVQAAQKSVSEYLSRQGITHAKVTEAFNVKGCLRVRYSLSSYPLVSLVIPTRNRIDLLYTCIASILNKTYYPNFEIIIVDNQSDDPNTLSYLQQLPQREPRVRVISYPHPFNYPAVNNFAVEQAKGELIGLLNNDIEVINEDWLTEMVSHALRPEIGAVGARLWYENNTLQHGGVILGIQGVAGHNHKYLPRGHHGYFSRARLVQNLSAVTGACIVLRKEVFTAVGGLNSDDLPIAFNDVDLCLKIQESLGLRIIWTPYAELYHHESASRGQEDTVEKQLRFASEINYMKQRWGERLLNDPAYSPNLTLDSEDFAIAWPPRVQINESFRKYFSTQKKSFLQCREYGYHLLKGHGLEIGALHQPAKLPPQCQVEYCDILPKAELIKVFRELNPEELVEVNYLCDLDKQGLSIFEDNRFDFVLFNHVIEHLANPIRALQEIFRITKVGGLVVVSAPDKDFTFDRQRDLTAFEHLQTEYQQSITEVTDEHYMDFLHHVHPELFTGEQEITPHLASVRNRHEHAHVWNSETFLEFLKKSFHLLKIQATCLFELTGTQNQYEYFSVWRKG